MGSHFYSAGAAVTVGVLLRACGVGHLLAADATASSSGRDASSPVPVRGRDDGQPSPTDPTSPGRPSVVNMGFTGTAQELYEHNAGTPYDVAFVVYFSGWFNEACDGHINSAYSVEQINAGVTPWLRGNGPGAVSIYAGTTLRAFVDQIHAAGGEVYWPLRRSDDIGRGR